MEILAIYLFLINALGFGIMYADKRRAKKNLWRIPERTLLTVALIGGSFGVLLGIRLLRHKTRKGIFAIGVPMVLALQVILVIFCFFLGNNI
jgi:uncharacterized membrane protein YsdA (DUF1294 family)